MKKIKSLLYISLIIFFISDVIISQCVIHQGNKSQYTRSFLSTYDDDGPSVSDSDIVNINGKLFFVADDGFSGPELWMIDDQTSEVVFVKDINPGKMGSFPSQLIELNGLLVFAAKTDLGVELWTSDGTEMGTQLILDIYPGVESSGPLNFMVNNSTLYFSATDTLNNRELWKTDGTTAGTMIVKDINQGTMDSNPQYLESCGSDIYFSAEDGVNGKELWKSDGSESGTVLIKDINVGDVSSNPTQLTCVNSDIFFKGSTTDEGDELWKSDGTSVGTVLVKDIVPGTDGSSPFELTPLNNELIFTTSEPFLGQEIWKSDGTEARTQIVADLAAGPEHSSVNNLRSIGSKIIFSRNSSELWQTDGTLEGTKELGPIIGTGFRLQNFTAIDNQVYFSGDDGELWATDGTNTGTMRLTNIPGIPDSNVDGMTKMGDNIYFVGEDGMTGFEMWKYNIITGTHTLTKDINAIENGTYYSDFLSTEDGFAFTSQSNFITDKLLQFDGSELTDILTSDDELMIRNFLGKINDDYFFIGDESIFGPELWKTDGTDEGTEIVRNIHPGTFGSNIRNPIIFNQKLFFSATNSITGEELWVSDGTWNGTVLLKDINSGTGSSFPRDFVIAEDILFFTDANKALHVTDGTTAGTVQLLSNGVSSLTSFGNKLIFEYNGVGTGDELWISDGTPQGTEMLSEIIPGYAGPFYSDIIPYDGGVYFAIVNLDSFELWKSDGTENGTVLVSTNIGSQPAELTIYDNDKLMFRSRTSDYDYKIWVSDGTDAGTFILDGDYSSIPFNLTANNNEVYFTADNTNGVKAIWSSDGTTSGTHLRWDLTGCFFNYNNIHSLQVFMDELYFIAPIDGKGSTALYKLNCTLSDCADFKRNTWEGPTKGDWSQTPIYWENGIPSFCDDVIIPPGNVVTIKQDKPAMSHTLDVKEGAEFNTIIGAELRVNN